MHRWWASFVVALGLGCSVGPASAQYQGGPIKTGMLNDQSGYLFEVKKPEENKGPWDCYKQLATTPVEEAWRPMDKGECPLVKK